MSDDIISTRFHGESDWEAVVNSAGLDIEEEQQFREWLNSHGIDILAHLEILEYYANQWLRSKGESPRQFQTVRRCLTCRRLVYGGPTRCARCAESSKP